MPESKKMPEKMQTAALPCQTKAGGHCKQIPTFGGFFGRRDLPEAKKNEMTT
jgi:hypothetical protein